MTELPNNREPEPDRLPTFIISVGTQVVLKSAKRVPGTDIVKPVVVKPVGSVAEVLEAPASNSRPYRIRFVDGATMRVKFAELVIRKRELDQELATPGPDLRHFVILRVAVGSQAFGLATDASDEDRRGVFLPPAELTWSLFKPPEQLEYASDGVEEVDWELEKFLRLALQANPTILETLWSPLVLHVSELGQELRDLRAVFPVTAPVQDVLRLRPVAVSADAAQLREDGQVQGQARHAPDPPALQRHPRPADRRDSSRCWRPSGRAARHQGWQLFFRGSANPRLGTGSSIPAGIHDDEPAGAARLRAGQPLPDPCSAEDGR